MNTSPNFPNIIKGIPIIVTLHIIYDHIKETKTKVQTELENMLANKLHPLKTILKTN